MRQINRVAVLGSGVMEATIAAHLANPGPKSAAFRTADLVGIDILANAAAEAEKYLF